MKSWGVAMKKMSQNQKEWGTIILIVVSLIICAFCVLSELHIDLIQVIKNAFNTNEIVNEAKDVGNGLKDALDEVHIGINSDTLKQIESEWNNEMLLEGDIMSNSLIQEIASNIEKYEEETASNVTSDDGETER